MKIRFTEKRQKILNILKSQNGTLSAGDIHKKIPEIDLVTIYRNLDLFTKEKIITKVQLEVNKVQYEYQKEPHHHAVCTDCEKVIHFNAPEEKLKEFLDIKNFEIEEIDLIVKGKCSRK